MNKFLLTYDVQTTSGYSRQVHAFISNNKFVDQWSLLFEGAYFLKSTSEFTELFQSIKEFFGEDRCVLALVEDDNEHTNGKLSKEIWTWFGDDDSQIQKLLPNANPT